MNIVLLNLPQEGEVKDFTTPEYLRNDFVRYPPLGLLYITAGIDKKHTVKIVDTVAKNMTIHDVVDYVKEVKPDLLGISVTTGRLYSMHSITKKIKDLFPDLTVVVGGPHVSAFPKETIKLDSIDYAFIGFGDKSFPLFVDSIEKINMGEVAETVLKEIPGLCYNDNGQLQINSTDNSAVNLDTFDFPDRKLMNMEDYYSTADKGTMTTLTTSRGCPFRCVYCDIPEKRYYARSAVNIVNEMEEIVNMGIKTIFIIDDTFNIKRKRVIDMCNEILKRKLDIKWSARVRVFPCDIEMLSLMKKAGCRRLHVGVESLEPNILKLIKKKISVEQIYSFFAICKQLKIETLAYFIVGFPQETKEYRNSFYEKIKKLSPTYLYINILYPATTSELYSDLLKQGHYKKDFWKDFIEKPVKDFEVPLFRSPELHNELLDFADQMHRKFYFSPKFILNDLRYNFSIKTFGLKVKGAAKLLYKTLIIKYLFTLRKYKIRPLFKKS